MAGTVVIDTITTGTGATVPTSTVVSGSAKAWVNFNGTGTVAIRGSFNVSSITDNGTGLYTVNLTNALADANYAVAVATSRTFAGEPAPCSGIYGGTYSSSAVTLQAGNTANVLNDALYFCVVFFR